MSYLSYDLLKVLCKALTQSCHTPLKGEVVGSQSTLQLGARSKWVRVQFYWSVYWSELPLPRSVTKTTPQERHTSLVSLYPFLSSNTSAGWWRRIRSNIVDIYNLSIYPHEFSFLVPPSGGKKRRYQRRNNKTTSRTTFKECLANLKRRLKTRGYPKKYEKVPCLRSPLTQDNRLLNRQKTHKCGRWLSCSW